MVRKLENFVRYCFARERAVPLHVVAQSKQTLLLHSAEGHSRNGGVGRPVSLPFLALALS